MRGIAGALILLGTAAEAQTIDPLGGYIRREDYREMEEINQRRYVTGVTDGMVAGWTTGDSDKVAAAMTQCLFDKKISQEQIRLTTNSIVEKAPEKLNEYAAGAVVEALLLICK